jgi:hypothetical protein
MSNKTYPLYSGTVTLEFDPAKHIYTAICEGKRVQAYGVTSCLGIINKPALLYWAVNKAIESLEKNWDINKDYDEVEKNNLLEEAKKAHRQFSKDAADIGTMFHSWAEDYINTKLEGKETPDMPKNKQLKSAVDSFLKWESENKVEWIEAEKKLYSIKYGFAGTCDGLAKVNGVLSAIDFKTSSGIYDEYFLQASAYAKAIEEEYGDSIKQVWIIRVSKTGGEFEAQKTENIDEHFKGFLGAYSLYKWQMSQKKNA